MNKMHKKVTNIWSYDQTAFANGTRHHHPLLHKVFRDFQHPLRQHQLHHKHASYMFMSKNKTEKTLMVKTQRLMLIVGAGADRWGWSWSLGLVLIVGAEVDSSESHRQTIHISYDSNHWFHVTSSRVTFSSWLWVTFNPTAMQQELTTVNRQCYYTENILNWLII